MTNIFLLLLIMASTACSFKSSDKSKSNSTTRTVDGLNAEELKKLDSDGDMISDYDEIQRGLDPFVANIPSVEVNFLQDYKIDIEFNDDSSFIIDTKIARDDPDFKYRVGDLFLKENSHNNAAKVGRFSGVSWGEIKQQDFSWVKYPEIDKEYYFNKRHEFESKVKAKVKQTTITLENSLQLKDSVLYKTIDQLELNFYYYSYSKESFVQLHTEKVDRVFQAGGREIFEITINNPPSELLDDTYFRHGEFIVSEVKDFYIPELKVKYSDLMASVKAKSIAIYRTTPFENELNYVAVKPDGEKFVSVMAKLYPDKFEVNDNKLIQVEQFANNLPDFKYLHEVASEDKAGNWFVMTNKLKEHYLKHNFTSNDSITISYIMGQELANRVQEQIYSFRPELSSSEKSKRYILGNVTNNSELSISLYLARLEGVSLKAKNEYFSFAPRCSGNCTGANWWVEADYQINSFKELNSPWKNTSYEVVFDAIEVLINNTSLDLKKLIQANHASFDLRLSPSGRQYVHITLKNLDKLEVIENGKENVAFIKLKSLSYGEIGEGVQVNRVGGANIDKVFHSGNISLMQSIERKLPLAVTSWKFDEWGEKIPWGQTAPNGFKIIKGNKKKYWEGTVFDVISTVTNNYN
jgi:hypothetical protein